MKRSYTLININYNLFEKVLGRLSQVLLPLFKGNNKFVLLNSMYFYYRKAYKDNSFYLWSQLLIAKYYFFESKFEELWVEELLDAKPDKIKGERILIQGPNLDYSKLKDKEFDRVIILKPNNFIYKGKVTLLNNHISSHLARDINYERFYFKFKEKSDTDIEYPIGTSNSFSLMGLQRAVYFCLKKLRFSEIHIMGFDLYAHTTYNRELYPTLITKSDENNTLNLSFFRHGLVGNFLFVKKLSEYFEMDSNVLTTTTEEYLKNVWINLKSRD